MPRGRPRKSVDPAQHDNDTHKSWDFTDFQVVISGDIGDARLAEWKHFSYSSLIIAEEVCPDTGRLHGQGRIVFKRGYRWTQMKKILAPDVSFQASKCTADDNYCRKMGTRCLINDRGHQGKRSVFKEQLEAVQAGSTLRECSELEGANYQSLRSAELLMVYNEPERAHAPRVVHVVDANAAMPSGCYRLNEMRFWNGYDAHTDVYINQSVCKLTPAQLRLVTSPAPFRVGRGRQARFNHIYISGLSSDECKALSLLPCCRRIPESLVYRDFA